MFARVDRPRLLQAVTAIERLARSPEDRARELILTRCRNPRRYLPLLLDTIDFQATDAGMPILDALEALRQIPTGRGLSRQELPTEFIPPPWRRLTEPEPGRIDRPAYTMCVLEAPRWAAPPRRVRRLQRALRRPARQPARRARLERVPL